MQSAAAAADTSRSSNRRNGRSPLIKEPVPFDTPEADTIVSALEVCRLTTRGTWSSRIGQCIPTRRTSSSRSARPRGSVQRRHGLRPGAADQKKVEVGSPATAESDKGPYPVPDNTPIEGWPTCLCEDQRQDGQTLDEVQRQVTRAATGTPSSSIRPTGCCTSSTRCGRPTRGGRVAVRPSST